MSRRFDFGRPRRNTRAAAGASSRPLIASSTSRNTQTPAPPPESMNKADRRNGYRPVVSIRLPPRVLEQLERLQNATPSWHRKRRSQLIVEAIEYWLKTNGAKK